MYSHYAEKRCDEVRWSEKKNSIYGRTNRKAILLWTKIFSQQQKSYLKDTTDFIDFIEKTKLVKEVILVDFTSLYTNKRPNIHHHSKVLTKDLI